MNKSLEAFIRGYVLFEVNGERFYNYNDARARRVSIEGDVYFKGYHVVKGWRYYFIRCNPYTSEFIQFVRTPEIKATT